MPTDITAIVKGRSQGHKQLGACPFSGRILLVLEEKEIPYNLEYVDLDNKPDWLLNVNPLGTVPVLRDHETDSYIVDSDTISDYLEEKYAPGKDIERKPLRKRGPQPGLNLWPRFESFLISGSPSDREQLAEELRQINGAVGDQAPATPYVGGEEPCAWDCAIAPRLYIARMGCKVLHGWDFAQEFPNVKTYLHRWSGRTSWRNTASWDNTSIIEDLRAKLKETSEKYPCFSLTVATTLSKCVFEGAAARNTRAGS